MYFILDLIYNQRPNFRKSQTSFHKEIWLLVWYKFGQLQHFSCQVVYIISNFISRVHFRKRSYTGIKAILTKL